MELFPQHCQLPDLTPHPHFRALTGKLPRSTVIASTTPKGRQLIKRLQANIKKILNPPIALVEQKVRDHGLQEKQQRVINETPILTVPNPTATRALKDTPCLHQCVTRNHSLGAVPAIIRPPISTPALCVSPRTKVTVISAPKAPMGIPSRQQQCLFTNQVINVLISHKLVPVVTAFTPKALISFARTQHAPCFEHYASPKVHAITGETISSYKKLMNDPATVEIW